MNDKSVNYKNFSLRPWQPRDRQAAADLIGQVLAEYGLGWEPEGADRDVLQVETCYLNRNGAFYVVERRGQLVGTGAYYPIDRGHNAVEIRKMYLRSEVRGQGVGRWVLGALEAAIASAGFDEIWIETATILKEGVALYESSGYEPASGVETLRCDRVYRKVIADPDRTPH
jgi:putative acetyltransferase